MNPAFSSHSSNNARKSWVKCSLCGHEFDENGAEMACKNCPMMKGCKLIRCPRCGFETPQEPRWLKLFKRRRENK